MIKSCKDITLEKFIKCIVDKQYSVLGKGTEINQYAAWIEIYNEYAQLVKDDTTMYLFELNRDITVLQEKIGIVDLCADILWSKYDRAVCVELNKLGFNVHLDWSKKIDYYKQLKLCLSRAKTWVIEISRKQKEVKTLLNKNKGEGYTRQYFNRVNANLGKYMSFYIDAKKVKVDEWCEWLNTYTEQMEAINNHKTLKNDGY